MRAAKLLRGSFEKGCQQGNQGELSKIAIIGGGLSGLATLFELYAQRETLLQNASTIEITIFDPHGFDGRGIPYAPPHDKPQSMIDAWRKLTLNVPTYAMLESEKHGLSFSGWAELRGYDECGYAPRYLFGDFLEDAARKIIDQIANTPGLKIEIVKKKVISAALNDNGIVLGDGEMRHQFDHVFLASGHIRTMRLEHLEGEQGYFRTPYNFSYVAMRTPDSAEAELLVWGGESSIVDFITIAEEMGYAGNYTIITRAAESLEMKRSISDAPLPPSYERFCCIRDSQPSRIRITHGFVHDTEIIPPNEDSKLYTVPATVLEYGEEREIEVAAANLVNASLWERGPTFTGGFFVSQSDQTVRKLRTDIPCTGLISTMERNGLIHFDPHDEMMRTQSNRLSIVGSPLMVGRQDMKAKVWSALNSWATAEDAVVSYVGKLHATGREFTPSAQPTVP